MFNKIIKNSMVYNSPDEMFEELRKADCCQDSLSKLFIEYCFDRYISYAGCNESVAEEAKEFIVYACACIMNELRQIPEDEMEKYYYEPDSLLEDIVEFGKFRGWEIDKHLALGLSVYIIEAYLTDNLPEVCEDYIEGPALEQIVAQMSDEVIDRIDDPVWERFLDKLLDEYDGDEDAVFDENDVARLQNLVRQRLILPCDYHRM